MPNDAYGYVGKILRINLTSGETHTEDSLKYTEEWLGAPGFAIKILYDELRSWVTPYDPANLLILGAGPLIGTTAPGACKMNISTLGPMTGGWATGSSDSYVGGELKFAGYDSVVIKGKAHNPVYLFIHDGKVEIRDASKVWGATTSKTLELIRDELADPSLHLISIGPAGENLVRGACIIQDKGRAFGRCGSGAVMGSKNLKAVVVKGSGSVEVAEPDKFLDSVKRTRNKVGSAPSVERTQKYGTLGAFPGKQKVCGIAYKNFQETKLPDDVAEEVYPMNTIDKYEISRRSFPGCGVHGCSRIVKITDGPYAGLTTMINQWEMLGSLQGKLAVREPTFMIKASSLCNDYGLDVDMAGGAIGWAIECFQRGIIDEKDTDGLKLQWDDGQTALELMRKISYREGFGDILAEGCARAADTIGRDSSYYAIHIKKQDLYEPCRGAMAWSLGTTTSTRGGGHTTGAPACETIPGIDIERAKIEYGVSNPDKSLEYSEKPEMVTFTEALSRAANCMGVCIFNTVWWDVNMMNIKDLAELYSHATGVTTTEEDLKKMSLKQISLEKAFNLRHTDFSRKDDLPTQRDLNEPIPTGNLAGWKMEEKEYNKMLDRYYELHGWDRETSYPTRATLKDLGIEYVADDLERIGKIGK